VLRRILQPGREREREKVIEAGENCVRSFYTSTPPHAFRTWCLVKHRDNITFTFTKLIRVIKEDDTNKSE
jgi:hypothetical protein